MKTLLGSTLEELKSIVKDFGLPAFTAKQIADWLYKKHVRSIDQMTNLSQKARAALAEQYEIGVTDPVQIATSADGTEKYLFKVGNNKHIESVFIPEKDRATLCISSQMAYQYCIYGHGRTAKQLRGGTKSHPYYDSRLWIRLES